MDILPSLIVEWKHICWTWIRVNEGRFHRSG